MKNSENTVLFSFKIDETFIKGEDPFCIIEPLWYSAKLYANEKAYFSSLRRFNIEQRYVLASWRYIDDMLNGGHSTYFFKNYSPTVVRDAVTGFKAMGLTNIANLIEEGYARLGVQLSDTASIRAKQLVKIEKLDLRFDDLDRKFLAFERKGTYRRAIHRYIKTNWTSFCFKGKVKRPTSSIPKVVYSNLRSNNDIMVRYYAEADRNANLYSPKQLEQLNAAGKFWQTRYSSSEGYVLSRHVIRVRNGVGQIAYMEYVDSSRSPTGQGLRTFLFGLLSDLYRKTGKMRLRFCGPDSKQAKTKTPTLATGFMPGIPKEIIQFAKLHKLTIPTGREIPDKVGRELFVLASGYSDLSGSSQVDQFCAAVFRCRGVFIRTSSEKLNDWVMEKERFPSPESIALVESAFAGLKDDRTRLYLLMREHIERSIVKIDNNLHRTFTCVSVTDDISSVEYIISDTVELPAIFGESYLILSGDEVTCRLFPMSQSALEEEVRKCLKELEGNPPQGHHLLLVFNADVRNVSAEIWEALSKLCHNRRIACFIFEEGFRSFQRELMICKAQFSRKSR